MSKTRRNNRMTHFLLLLLLSGIILVNKTHAQAYQPERTGLTDNWRINLNAGSTTFYGDLKEKGILPYDIDYKLGYGIIFRKQLSPAFSLGGQIFNSKLKSTQKYIEEGVEKAVTFDADVFEYNLQILFDFTSLSANYSPHRKLNPYIFCGLGLSNWKTTVSNYRTGEVLRRHGFTGKGPGKRTSELVMPFGLGLRYNISKNLGLSFETSLHLVNSDFLDATSADFAYDMYNYTSLGISLYLNGNKDENERAREVTKIKKKQARRKNNQIRNNYKEPSKYYYEDIRRSEPINQPEPEIGKTDELEGFKKEYAADDLPVVAEYNLKGVFEKNNRNNNRSFQQEAHPGLRIEDIPAQRLSQKNISENEQQFSEETTTSDEVVSFEQTTTDVSPKLVYGVQILATKAEADVNLLYQKYDIKKKISARPDNGLIRYTVVSFPTYQAAVSYARILHQRGLADAFVVAYKNGRRVPIK